MSDLALARSPITATPEFRAFHNGLRILRNLDKLDLVGAGILATPGDWNRFGADPCLFFIKASDDVAARLWGLVQARQPEELRAERSAA